MGSIKISIITVSYNAEKTIEQAIRSVISQKYDNVEYIIIDGGSTDSTIEIIQSYSSNISFWISELDDGIYDAMNKGVCHAKGEVIAFLNSDDYYVDGALSAVANYFEQHEDVDILCGEVLIERNGILRTNRNPYEKKPEKLREGFMMYSHQGIFAKKECFALHNNFDLKYKIAADYDWLLKMYNSGKNIQYIPDIVAVFRFGGYSGSRPFQTTYEIREVAQQSAQALLRMEKISEKEYETLSDKIEKEIQKRLIYTYSDVNIPIIGKIAINDRVNKRKRYVFGAGALAVAVVKVLKRLSVQVDCCWDNDENKWGMYIEGIPIKNPQDILDTDCCVIVASHHYEDEIVSQLKGMHLEEGTNFFYCEYIFEQIETTGNS